MPFEETLLEPVSKGFDAALLEPVEAPQFIGPPTETLPEKGVRLRQELQQVRESPEAVTAPTIGGDITAPEFAGIPEYQAAYHTPLRLPRVGAPTPEPTDVEPFRPTIEGPMSSMMRGVTKGEARDVAPIAANAVIGAVEPLADPMMPAVIGGMVVAPEVVIPAFTAQMGKSGAINLAEGLEALRAGRREEGVQKVGAAIPELGFAAAPAFHPGTFTRSLEALGREPIVAPPGIEPAAAPVSPAAAAPAVVAGEHPLLAAANIVEQAAGRVEASGQVPAQKVADAIARVRMALEDARQQAAAIGQQPAAAAGEAIAGGQAAPASAADAAYAAAKAALDRADAIVAGAGAPRPSGELPPVDATDVANALQAAIAATRQFHAVVNQPQTQEQNASSQQKAAEVYGDLRPQPVEGEETMPEPQSSGGVQPQAGEPTVAGAREGDQGTAQPTVPLGETVPLEAPATEAPKAAAPAEEAAAVAETAQAEPPKPVEGVGLPIGEGPGAATPAEFGPEKPFTTGAANAVTAEKRTTLGMPKAREEAARTWGSVWEEVQQQVAENPGAGQELVADLKAKPRPLTDREVALLDHESIGLEDRKNRIVQQMLDAAETEGDVAIPELRAQLDGVLDQLYDVYEATKSAGREQARAFNIRKAIVDENYSLTQMQNIKRAMNDGERLSKDQMQEVKDLYTKISEAETKYNDYVKEAEERIRKLEVQHAADELKIAAAREAKADAESGTVRDLTAERDAIVGGLGERANTPLRDLRPWIRKLALNLVRSGVTERNALVNAVHDVLKDIIPGIQLRDTMDAISGYGEFRPLDPEAAKAKLRDLSGQMQNVSKLEDLLARRALKKTGPERKTLSDEERRLIKLVNEYKRRYGVTVTDPATQLKSALASVKTRLTNQIKDLEFQIGTGKKIVKGATKVAYDSEATALQARRDVLKQQFDEIFGKPELTDEQRVAMATKAVEKSITEIQRRIAAGETRTGKPLTKTPVTPELTSLREQQAALRDQLQSLRDADTALQEEKAVASLQSTIADLERRISESDLFAERKAQADATAITAPLKERRAALQQQLAELRRISPEGIARAESTRIAAIEKEIADLEGRITRGELDLAKKPARILSEAEKGRREVLAQTREILREARERAGIFDADRIANAEKAVDRAIAETIRQINEGDIGTRAKPERLTSPEIEAKRAELEDLKKVRQQMRDVLNPKKTKEQIALDTLKTRLRTQVMDYNMRMARGDFNVPVRKPIALDAEALHLQRIRDYNKARFQESLAKDRFDKLTRGEKVWSRTKAGLDLSRSFTTSFDLSALLRQGKFIVAGHPVRAFRGASDMVASLLSKDKAHTLQKQLENRPNYPKYKQSGLFIAEENARVSNQEEAYMMQNKMLEKIPLLGRPAAASQRAYTTFLNRLRADSFDAMSESLSRHSPISPEEAKVISNFINAATGRGSLDTPIISLERAATTLNRVFFSPRYVASRFQLLFGPLSGFRFGKGATGRTRALIAEEYAKTLIGYAAFYIMAKMALPDSEIEIDPRSSDAGKIRIGKTRLDPLAGLQQATVLLTRTIGGETKTLNGRILPIRGEDVPYGGTTTPGTIGNFLRSKLAPIPGTALNVMAGKNVVGEPVTPLNFVTGLTVPMAFQDIKKAIEDQGLPRAAALTLLSILGEGVQVYDDR